MSSDEGVSPRKQRRVERKKKNNEEESDDKPSSSRRSLVLNSKEKEKSPERKRKGRRGRVVKEPSPEEEIHVDAAYQPSDEEDDDDEEQEASEEAETEDTEEERSVDGRMNGSRRHVVNDDETEEYEEDQNAKIRLLGTDDDSFEIPSRDDDLLLRQTGYRLTEVMDMDEAMAAVELFEDEVQQHRWRMLYDRFPAFFALLKSSSGNDERVKVPAALRARLVTSLILAYSHMNQWLKKVLGKAASAHPPKKCRAHCRDMSDHLLMLIYLLHKMVIAFEDEAKSSKRKPVARRAAGGRGRPRGGGGAGGRGRAVQNEDGDMLSGGDDETEGGGAGGGAEDESSWEENRLKLIETLTEIVNTTVVNAEGKTCEGALRHLWQTGNVDQEMIRCLLQSALKFLENPDITRPHSRPVLTAVFKLVRALCTTFSYFTYIGKFLFEKLLSLDYYKEGAASTYPFLERIKAVAVNKDTDKLIDGMLKYFASSTITVSNNNAKSLCLFMHSITEVEPYKVMFMLQPFVALLTDENASVRSTVLNVLTMLLTQDFLDAKRQLSPRFISAKNNMFDKLLQHVRDINANVRASALKCLTALAKAQKIPTELIQEGLVQLVGQRIGDDKVAVRKEAVRFATIFLENNPYGHDFDRISNERALKETIQKRDRIRAQTVDLEAVNQAQKIFESFKVALAEEVGTCAEEHLMGDFTVPTEEERKTMYRDFYERQQQSQHGGGSSQEEPSDVDMSMRWLFSTILADEKSDMKVPARLLFAMAITDQLRTEHVTLATLQYLDSPEKVATAVMDAGHILFMNTASMLISRDDEAVLRKEQDSERKMAMDARLSKDIDDLLMKIVLEHEFAQCLPSVMGSVMSGEGGDLKLGIDFVVKCKEFNITGSEGAVRQLCALVWKSDEEGRTQILQAASSMFLSTNSNPRLRDAATCENILNLVKSMSDHERGSVEQVLALTTKFEPMPVGVYTLLWEQVDEESIGQAGVSVEKKRKQVAAMKALCLLSRSDVKRNRQWLRRYQNIVKEGWPEIAAEALGCIANLATRYTKEDKPVVGEPAYRIPGNDSIFPTIQQFMLAELCREEARTWNRSLRATLDIYFHICKDTCEVASQFVAKIMWLLRRTSQALHYYDQQMGVEEMRGRKEDANIDPMQKEMVAEERSKYLTRLWAVLVERLCVLAGELAVRLLVHADLTYTREFMQLRERMVAEEGNATPFPNRTLKPWELKSATGQGIFAWSDSALTIELTGLTEEERIRNKAQIVVEHRLMTHHKLLGRLLPIVVHAARAKGTPPRVRFQAVAALAKFMIVAPTVAQRGARTFFAFLNNAHSPILRSNLTVTAADLTFRHPNLVENHAASLFAQLQDRDSCVREACMLVLNHLISNDQIKTHGVLSYALTGYVDPVPSIQHITRGMFNEWCKKEGVMSHVPDFISRLSRDSQEVPIESFKIIMSNFLPLIRERKDSNVQALVEKLCKRFEFAKSPRVIARNPDLPAYYSYCLQLLSLNARSFHKMVDCLDNYKQFLGDDRVYEDISTLVRTFHKDDNRANGGSSDISDEVITFVRKLQVLHEQQKTEKEVEGKIARMRFDSSHPSTSHSTIARKMRSRKVLASTSATPARGGRGRGAKRNARIESSDEEDSDEDEE